MPDLVRYGSFDFPAGTSATIAHPVVRNPHGPLLTGAETWTITGWLAPSATYAAAETAHAALLSAVDSDGDTLALIDTDGNTVRTMPDFQEDSNGPYVTSVTFDEPVAVWGTRFTVEITNVAPPSGASTTAREKLLGESSATMTVAPDENGELVETYQGTLIGTRSATYALLKQHLNDLVLARIGDRTLRSFTVGYDLFRQVLTFTISALTRANDERPQIVTLHETLSISTAFNLVIRRKPRGGAPIKYQHGDFITIAHHQVRQEGATGFLPPRGPVLGFGDARIEGQETTSETPRLDAQRRPVAWPTTETYTYEIPSSRIDELQAAFAARIVSSPVLAAPLTIDGALSRIVDL